MYVTRLVNITVYRNSLFYFWLMKHIQNISTQNLHADKRIHVTTQPYNKTQFPILSNSIDKYISST